MTKSDDFLTKVLKAEEEAAAKVAKAKSDKIKNLKKFEDQLVKAKDEKLEIARSQVKDSLKAKQLEARVSYEKQLAEGDREIKTLEKELDLVIEKQEPVAQVYFLNEVL